MHIMTDATFHDFLQTLAAFCSRVRRGSTTPHTSAQVLRLFVLTLPVISSSLFFPGGGGGYDFFALSISYVLGTGGW